jgi:hypothetical protein
LRSYVVDHIQLLAIFLGGHPVQAAFVLSFALFPAGEEIKQDLDIVAAQQAGSCCSQMKAYKDPYAALCRRSGMISRFRVSVRRAAGMILIVAGILFWILVIVLPPTSFHVGLLTSLNRAERQSFPVIAGGASLVGGIMLLLAPRRRQRRRYFDEGESFRSLAQPSSPTRGHWASPIVHNLDFKKTMTPRSSHLNDERRVGGQLRRRSPLAWPGTSRQV